jgi:hypothetical protein
MCEDQSVTSMEVSYRFVGSRFKATFRVLCSQKLVPSRLMKPNSIGDLTPKVLIARDRRAKARMFPDLNPVYST